MPTPKKDEKKHEFIERCIPYVIDEEKKKGKEMDPDAAYAKCNGIWEQKKKEK